MEVMPPEAAQRLTAVLYYDFDLIVGSMPMIVTHAQRLILLLRPRCRVWMARRSWLHEAAPSSRGGATRRQASEPPPAKSAGAIDVVVSRRLGENWPEEAAVELGGDWAWSALAGGVARVSALWRRCGWLGRWRT